VDSQTKQLHRGWQEPPPRRGNVAPVTDTVAEPSELLTRRGRLPLVLLGTAVAATAAVVMLLLLSGGHKTPTPALPTPNAGPQLVSQAQLDELARSTPHPVYWAGPKAGYSYELTRTSNGRIYVRYLPNGVKAGDSRPNFLVVGTYEQPGSFAYLRHASGNRGSVALDMGNGGIVLVDAARPSSAYFAYPRTSYQVEVYDPAEHASRLVFSGTIRPLR
jgi:hypothetical protein